MSMSPRDSSSCSSSRFRSKWSSIARFWLLVMMMTCSIPASTASSTAYWMTGLSTSGSISFGWALVAGRKRVPQPAAGKTAFRTRILPQLSSGLDVAYRGEYTVGPAATTRSRTAGYRPELAPTGLGRPFRSGSGSLRHRHRVDELVVVAMDSVAQTQSSGLDGQPYRPHQLADMRATAEQRTALGHPGEHVAGLGVELERSGIEARGFVPEDGRLGGHDVQDADPPGRAFDDPAAAGAADSHVVGDDRGDLDAVQFHGGRIVAGHRRPRRRAPAAARGACRGAPLDEGSKLMWWTKTTTATSWRSHQRRQRGRSGATTTPQPGHAPACAPAWPSSSSRTSTPSAGAPRKMSRHATTARAARPDPLSCRR